MINKDKLYECAAGYVCFCLPEGKICRISGIDKVKSLPGVYKACLSDLQVGKRVMQITDGSMRLGPILVSGKNRLACQETINTIKEALVIEVDTTEGINGIIW